MKQENTSRNRGAQYVRLPKGVLINPNSVKFVVPLGHEIHLHYSKEEFAWYGGTVDSWIYAVRRLAVNPLMPVVDLIPDFVYETGGPQDDLNEAIPDEKATKV